jgi:hypothetical protein
MALLLFIFLDFEESANYSRDIDFKFFFKVLFNCVNEFLLRLEIAFKFVESLIAS